jgi:hypothetical protein
MGCGLGEMFLKKKWLLWAMEAWLKMGALEGSRAVATRIE